MFDTVVSGISWVESQQRFKPKSDLLRMNEAFRLSGITLEGMKKIHIAGTNGKGSVASYTTHILRQAGYRVGMYTSPYLVVFNERIRINFEPVSDVSLLVLLNWVYDLNETVAREYGERLSFFELVTMMAFRHFEQAKVTHLVIEVGLGGLLDATNILNYDLSLITNIGFDHMKQLGNTKESIAYNKLGILKPGHRLLTTVDPEMYPFFESELKRIGVEGFFLTDHDVIKCADNPLTFKYQGETFVLSMLGDHQIRNALLALHAIKEIEPAISLDSIKEGFSKTVWDGRLELIPGHCKTYLDGAHNAHAMEALKKTAGTLFEGKRILVVFASLSDKDIDLMLKIVRSFSDDVILTSFPDHRVHDLSLFEQDDMVFIKDPMEAYRFQCAKASADDVILVTGSLHFVGYMKRRFTP